MADELIQSTNIIQGNGIGAWWSNPKHSFLSSATLSSPCSAALGSVEFGWKGKSWCSWEDSISLIDDSSMDTAQNLPSLCPPSPLPPRQPEAGGANRGTSAESSLELMGFRLSPSSTIDWNQHTFIEPDGKYNFMLQEDVHSRLMNYEDAVEKARNGVITNQTSIPKCWSSSKDLSIGMNSGNSSIHSTTTCDSHWLAAEPSFPMSPSTSSYHELIQILLDSDDHHQIQPQGSSLFEESKTIGYGSWPRVSQQHDDAQSSDVSPLINSYSNMSSMNDEGSLINIDPCSRMINPSTSSSKEQGLSERRPDGKNCKAKKNVEKIRDLGLTEVMDNNEPSLKKPRIETPSPLPTFKVRKEKLGDRITALQQLVSPFGKTDTASVLHEAIEYIKFLHDQVNVLTTPYLLNEAQMQQQQQHDQQDNNGVFQQDLSSRGLCLVPISFTFPVAHETPVDFWTPSFGPTPPPTFCRSVA